LLPYLPMPVMFSRSHRLHSAAAAANPAARNAPSGTLHFDPPADDLVPQFEYLWQLVLPSGTPPDAFWRVVVDGYIDIALRLPLTDELLAAAGSAKSSLASRSFVADALAAGRAVICGAATTSRSVPMDVPLLMTGARFRLGAARSVLKDSVADLVDGSTPIRELIDPRTSSDIVTALAGGAESDAMTFRETSRAEETLRIMARESVQAVARRLVARATARQSSTPLVDRRVSHALRLLDQSGPAGRDPRAGADDQSSARISAIACELAVSQRTLERLFSEHVGFAPRTYQRLRRVGAVAEALERSAGALRRPGERRGAERKSTLSALAQDLGYTDHAHMTREFVRVMGVVPSIYRREAQNAHVDRQIGAVAFERTIPHGTIGQPTL
jgi:AraC-like DNA-binding protein